MKIAIPTRAYAVDDHFGHCETYTIFTIDQEKHIKEIESFPFQKGCGCKSNVASLLQQMGVTVMLAGNMGNGALSVLTSYNIKVYKGCSGDVTALVNQFLNGNVVDSGESCQYHQHEDDDHACNHN